MHGLEATDGEPFGVFRGEPGLETYDVRVGGHGATPAGLVRAELAVFDATLASQLEELDRIIRRGHFAEDGSADNFNAVLILCAWAHGEWVRIHPFPNGNGRTARILVNSIGLRYGLPAFMRIRPRPGSDYEYAAYQAMEGNWKAGIPVCIDMYLAALGG